MIKFNFGFEKEMYLAQLAALREADKLFFSLSIKDHCQCLLSGDLTHPLFKDKDVMPIAMYGTKLGLLTPSQLLQVSHCLLYFHYQNKGEREPSIPFWDRLFNVWEPPERIRITVSNEKVSSLDDLAFEVSLPEGTSLFHPSVDALYSTKESGKLRLARIDGIGLKTLLNISYSPSLERFICTPGTSTGAASGSSALAAADASFSSGSATSSPAR